MRELRDANYPVFDYETIDDRRYSYDNARRLSARYKKEFNDRWAKELSAFMHQGGSRVEFQPSGDLMEVAMDLIVYQRMVKDIDETIRLMIRANRDVLNSHKDEDKVEVYENTPYFGNVENHNSPYITGSHFRESDSTSEPIRESLKSDLEALISTWRAL